MLKKQTEGVLEWIEKKNMFSDKPALTKKTSDKFLSEAFKRGTSNNAEILKRLLKKKSIIK